jgi:hypothetical protein
MNSSKTKHNGDRESIESQPPKDMDPRLRGDDIEAGRAVRHSREGGNPCFPAPAYAGLLKLIPARREVILKGEV